MHVERKLKLGVSCPLMQVKIRGIQFQLKNEPENTTFSLAKSAYIITQCGMKKVVNMPH